MPDPHEYEIPEQYCTQCREWRPCACDDEARQLAEDMERDYRESEPWPEPEYTDEGTRRHGPRLVPRGSVWTSSR